MENEQSFEPVRWSWQQLIGGGVLAICGFTLVFMLSSHHTTSPVPQPIQAPVRASVPPKSQAIPFEIEQPQAKKKSAPTKKVARKAATKASPSQHLQVVGLTDDMVVLMENDETVTLRIGQRSPNGWKLLKASAARAILQGPDGKKLKVTSSGIQRPL